MLRMFGGRVVAGAVPAKALPGVGRCIALLVVSVLAATSVPGLAAAQGAVAPVPGKRAPAVTDLLRQGSPPVLSSPGGAEAERETQATADNEAASSADGEPERQAGGVEPAAADEPGQQVPPPPAAPATPASPPEWFWRDAEIAQAFECPIGPIATLMEAAQGESEFSPALAVERQVLSLCRDRWTVLKELMDAELSLASVMRANATAEAETDLRLAAAREREAIALETARREADARVRAAHEATLAAARAERERDAAAAAAAAAPKQEAPEPAPGPAPEEIYGWFALKGSGSDLRAGVTDGRGRWWVGVGDELPGGVRIGSIRSRPPRVAVKGGAAAGLPYRPVGR